jgi:hypothetical protein
MEPFNGLHGDLPEVEGVPRAIVGRQQLDVKAWDRSAQEVMLRPGDC